MSLITPDFGLIFWMTLIFAVVFFILAKFGFPIITGMVDKRSERIAEAIRKADEAEQRLSALAAQQQEMIESARQEQGRILKEATQTRDKIVAQAREQASADAAAILEHAKMEIAAERESAIRDIRHQVSVISVNVADKILRAKLEAGEEQSAFVDRLVDEASKTHLQN